MLVGDIVGREFISTTNKMVKDGSGSGSGWIFAVFGVCRFGF